MTRKEELLTWLERYYNSWPSSHILSQEHRDPEEIDAVWIQDPELSPRPVLHCRFCRCPSVTSVDYFHWKRRHRLSQL